MSHAPPPVSLAMIVRNEQQNLERCLTSVQGLFGEIVIVDTGSSDRTIEIAQRFTDQVYVTPWQDSFSVARNTSLQN